MVARGKWGLTRNPGGELAIMWEWPWYWRYPAAAAVLAAGLWMCISISANGRSEWLLWLVGGFSALIALSFAYELGCLVVVVAFFAGVLAIVKAVFPEVSISPQAWIWLVGAFAYYAWYVANQARQQADTNRRAIDNVWSRLNEFEQSRQFHSGDVYEEIEHLRMRVRKLERDTSDPFGLGQ
ncbi:hypothetical protein AE929_13140 [Xanthomonas arboricola]|nr:hypothetical protein [Xanthomonas arboricola]KOA99412.1 hypothetical protein AE920_12145 [Xanthomonas arboricola]KOB18331.1 hypothetical protein AE924_01420 [Xanthomonas arboricola]KOB34944.1 hypothetical protein AE929_13140 [Xanthomonas arboricola]OAH83376.1 hypothetical protein AXA70_02915 [Xanthomonas arboricola pv. juglandis]